VEKQLADLASMTNQRFKKLEDSIEQLSSRSKSQTGRENGERSETMPIYKCKGKDCGFATDDIAEFVLHTVKENLPKPSEEREEETPPAPRKRHQTAKDWLSCPECSPAFEKAIVELGIPEKLGYAKKEPEKQEKTEKRKKGGGQLEL